MAALKETELDDVASAEPSGGEPPPATNAPRRGASLVAAAPHPGDLAALLTTDDLNRLRPYGPSVAGDVTDVAAVDLAGATRLANEVACSGAVEVGATDARSRVWVARFAS